MSSPLGCAADTCYVLSFAVIMLNTSLHNPNVRDKPGLERFVAMNRGINEGGDLPEELLRVRPLSPPHSASSMGLPLSAPPGIRPSWSPFLFSLPSCFFLCLFPSSDSQGLGPCHYPPLSVSICENLVGSYSCVCLLSVLSVFPPFSPPGAPSTPACCFPYLSASSPSVGCPTSGLIALRPCQVALGGSQGPGVTDWALAPQNLYDSIRNEPFKIPEDDGNDLTHTFFNPDREGWLLKLGTSPADPAGSLCRGKLVCLGSGLGFHTCLLCDLRRVIGPLSTCLYI